MKSMYVVAAALCCVVIMLGGRPFYSETKLDPSFYNKTCPRVHSIVHEVIHEASLSDPRILASLTRLHFHDCFVLVCVLVF